jgi:hypothetical protein
MQGRIWFEDNPWPRGHRIEALEFSLLLDDVGLALLLHLRSEDYFAEDTDEEKDREDDEDTSDWDARIVWGNYHRCTLSNTHWGVEPDRLPRLTDLALPLDHHAIPALRIEADPVPFGEELPMDDDNHAFHIYLLGHDAVASHDVKITPQGNGLYALVWTGLIALAYAGHHDFSHRFRAEAKNMRFTGFAVLAPGDLGTEEREAHARKLAQRHLARPETLRFECAKRGTIDRLLPA